MLEDLCTVLSSAEKDNAEISRSNCPFRRQHILGLMSVKDLIHQSTKALQSFWGLQVAYFLKY